MSTGHCRKKAAHQVAVADRSQVGLDRHGGKARGQLLANGVQRVFRVVEQQQAGRREGGDLAAQFAANRAAGTRDENIFIPDATRKQFHLRGYGSAPQPIFEFQFADGIAGRDLVIGKVDQAAQYLDGDAGLGQLVHDCAQPFGRYGRNGNHDGVVAQRADNFRLPVGMKHAQAGNIAFVEDVLVVKKAHRAVFIAAAHRQRKTRPRFAGAVDRHRFRLGAPPRVVVAQEIADADPGGDDVGKHDKPVDRQCAARKPLVVDGKQDQIGVQHGDGLRPAGHAEQTLIDEADDRTVQVGHGKCGNRDHRHQHEGRRAVAHGEVQVAAAQQHRNQKIKWQCQ